MTLFSILENAAQKFADKPALIDHFGSLSFEQLLQCSSSLYSELVSTGLRKDMGVGLIAPQGREFVTGLFATSACGPVVMPIDSNIREAELKQLLARIPLAAIVSYDNGERWPSLNFQKLTSTESHWSVAWLNSDNTDNFASHVPNACVLRPSSGTTGIAKGVVLSLQSVKDRAVAASQALNLTSDDRIVWVLPMAYHFIVSIITYVHTGCCLIVSQNQLAKSIISASNSHNGSILYAAPTHYAFLADDSSEERMPTLKMAYCTSAPIAPATASKFEKRYGLPLRQLYGLIEVGLPVGNLGREPAAAHSLGKALLPYSAEVQDSNGVRCAVGQVGELVFKGPGMFDGYLSPAIKREEALRNGWFLSGDIAIQKDDGSLELQGRKKSVINIAGNKVHPEEVESLLNSHPQVSLSRVFSKSHPLLGEVVCAEVVLKDQASVDAASLQTFCRQSLCSYKAPHTIDIVRSIALTSTGKVVRV